MILIDTRPRDISLDCDTALSHTPSDVKLPRFARLRLLLSLLLLRLSVFLIWVSRAIARLGVKLAVWGRRLVTLGGSEAIE